MFRTSHDADPTYKKLMPGFSGDSQQAATELASLCVCGMKQHSCYYGIENQSIGNIRLQVASVQVQVGVWFGGWLEDVSSS